MFPFLRKLHGFINQKLGRSLVSGHSRDYCTGWFIGAGIKVSHWYFASPKLGRKAYRVSLFIQTRNDLGFKSKSIELDGRRIKGFFMGFMAVSISFKIHHD